MLNCAISHLLQRLRREHKTCKVTSLAHGSVQENGNSSTCSRIHFLSLFTNRYTLRLPPTHDRATTITSIIPPILEPTPRRRVNMPDIDASPSRSSFEAAGKNLRRSSVAHRWMHNKHWQSVMGDVRYHKGSPGGQVMSPTTREARDRRSSVQDSLSKILDAIDDPEFSY
jgi:hypothetical protein